MKVQRLTVSRPHRDNLWLFVEAMQAQMALQPDENAHALAGTLAAVAVLRGTRRGAALEVGFVALHMAWSLVTALIPGVSRRQIVGCWLCRKPVHRLYIVHWLLWAFIFGSLPEAAYVCPEPAHNLPAEPVFVVASKP